MAQPYAPKPAPVASGETVEAAWGVGTIDFEHSKMKFVRVNRSGGWSPVENSPAPSGNAYVELDDLPANDPDILYAEVQCMVRHSDGTNTNMALKHYTTDLANAKAANLKYNTGTNIGGMSGGVKVRVGGVNNRQIIWSAGGTGHWIRVLGYWTLGVKAPYPLDGDPIIAGWGEQVTRDAGNKWEYHHAYGTILNAVDGLTGKNPVVVPFIPANDPNVIAIVAAISIRDKSGAGNLNATLYDYDEGFAGGTYTSGVQDRGGLIAPIVVFVGGAANNEIKWASSEAGANVDISVWCLGWYTRETASSPQLPPLPEPSGVISSAWGNALNDLIGKKERFVSFGPETDYFNVLNAVDGKEAIQLLTLPAPFPQNDPNVVAAELLIMIRDSNGSQNLILYIHNYDETVAGFTYTDGVQDRGGTGGPHRVAVGGTNNAQVKWHSSEDTADLIDVWVYVTGYWTRED